jgi:ribonuclease HI
MGTGLRLMAYTDGASRGNPGPASYGAVVLDAEGGELRAISVAIGVETNNVAEYRGAIAAVEAALELGASALELRMDSQLIVRQLEGRYRVKNAGLKPLFLKLQALLEQLDEVAIRHVPREENRRADALANAALDGRSSDLV